MNDEEMKRLWQNQPLPEPAADVAALVKAARRKHRKFQRTILWRDFREVVVALVLIPIFLPSALKAHAPWTSFLIVLALLFVSGFLVIDRLRRRGMKASPGATMVDALAQALRDVEHQIWLLRNVLWWYIGPLAGALIIHDAYRLLSEHSSLSRFLVSLGFNVLIGCWVWNLNQRAVKRDLEPRRDDLQKLLEQVR